jgi:hypothetical protein
MSCLLANNAKYERYVPNDICQTSNDIGKVQVIVDPHTKKILIPGLSLHPCILLSRFYYICVKTGTSFKELHNTLSFFLPAG